jgi:hypothetical protein
MNDIKTTWPDDVKRVCDAMNLHAVAKSRGWLAFSMADGKPLDGNDCYETWNDAVRAAKWDRDNYMFLEVQPSGMQPEEAHACLTYARTLSKAGFRIPSPDWEHGQAMSMPVQPADRKTMLRQLVRGTPIYPEDIPYSNLPRKAR